MCDDLKNRLLLKEYDTAVSLTHHIDELRNKFTSFYLTFSGFILAGIAFFLKGEIANPILGDAQIFVAMVLLITALMGSIIVRALARLRAVQIEHFRIISNIRSYIFKQDYLLWNTVQLSEKTLPIPNRNSGTYMWLLLVLITSMSFLGFSVYILCQKLSIPLLPSSIVALISSISFFKLQDVYYFRCAHPTCSHTYSNQHRPSLIIE